jgi:hypothetical protein
MWISFNMKQLVKSLQLMEQIVRSRVKKSADNITHRMKSISFFESTKSLGLGLVYSAN